MSDSRIAVVTGSRKGLGRTLVENLLEQGFIVFGCSRRKSDLEHDNYIHFELDVADEPSVRKMVTFVRKTAKHVDVLINNAGIASMNHAILTPLDSAKNVVNTNLIGTFNVTKQFAPLMKERPSGGRVVNFSTVAVPFHLGGEAIYAASKAGVEELTRVLAHELAAFGIRVNAVGPTPVETDLIKNVPREKLDELMARQAIPRFATQQDVWRVVEFFIEPENDMVSGQVIYLGGVF